MQTAEADFPGIEYLLNSWHQRSADTVIKLNQVKPKFGFDFVQHCIAGGVAFGVPRRGERNHRLTNIGRFWCPFSAKGAGLMLAVKTAPSALKTSRVCMPPL